MRGYTDSWTAKSGGAGRERIPASLIHIFKTLPCILFMLWSGLGDVINSGNMAAGDAQILSSFLGLGISFSHKTLHTIVLKSEGSVERKSNGVFENFKEFVDKKTVRIAL